MGLLIMKKIRDICVVVGRKVKAFAFTLAFVLGVGSAFAEDSNAGIDLTPASTALATAQTQLASWVTSNMPILVKILGAFLVVSMVFVVFGWIRRASKGR